MWPHVYVICMCLVFLSVGDLLVHKQITNRQEHQTHTESEVLKRIFGPRRDEVTGEWRKLRNDEINDLYSSSKIFRVIK